MRDQGLGPLDAEPGQLARGRLHDRQSLGRLALAGASPGSIGPAAIAQPGLDARPDRLPGAGLADDDRAPGAERLELGRQRSRGDPLAEDDPADRRVRPKQGRSVRRAGRRPLGQPVVERVDDAMDLGDPRLVEIGRRVEPCAPDSRGRGSCRSGRGRRPAAGRGATDGVAGPGPPDARRARPSAVRDRATSGCADRRPRRRPWRSPAGSRGSGSAGPRSAIASRSSVRKAGLAFLGEHLGDRPARSTPRSARRDR